MPKARQDRPVVKLRPSSYQPSKAELEEDVRIDATPERLFQAAASDVDIVVSEPD